jgi:hypothetical protein
MKNGTPDIMDLCFNVRPHYKNIEEALKIERPTDKVVKILSNKFAVVKCMFTDGTFEKEQHVMFIDKGTEVFSAGILTNMKRWCARVEESPRCTHIGWYLINPQTKRDYYKIVHSKMSKYKRLYRKLSKLI